jgi:anaerobic ribonucleoside-triphosphate reductase
VNTYTYYECPEHGEWVDADDDWTLCPICGSALTIAERRVLTAAEVVEMVKRGNQMRALIFGLKS